MARVKRGVASHARHKRLLKRTKGFRGNRSRVVKRAKEADMKAGQNAYRDRRLKKRDFRALWNNRISAGAKMHGMNYSRFIGALFNQKIALNRKMLSELAFQYPDAFGKVVERVR